MGSGPDIDFALTRESLSLAWPSESIQDRIAWLLALAGWIKPAQPVDPAAHVSRCRRLLRTCVPVAMLVFGLACSGAGWAQETQTPEQEQAQARLDELRVQIAALAAQQRESGTRRDALQANLAQQADVLAAAAKAVRESETNLAGIRTRLADLRTQERALESGLEAQRDALAELLRAAYTLGRGSDLRLLLGHVASCARVDQPEDERKQAARPRAFADDACRNGERMLERISRALAYSRYFQRDRMQRIRNLLGELGHLDSIRKSIETEQLSMQAMLDERSARAKSLQAARDRKAALLTQVESSLKTRAGRLQQLQRDQQALEELLASLRDVFADIPRGLAAAKPFASLRGELPWPIEGKPSPQDQGVLIRAVAGSMVRAVAHGRVAYADWLRGYGMLMILDHGDGWMSLYGGNESLLHSVGEWVDAGEVIATSGRAEGGQPGLYFGLRHDGADVNPQSWLRTQ